MACVIVIVVNTSVSIKYEVRPVACATAARRVTLSLNLRRLGGFLSPKSHKWRNCNPLMIFPNFSNAWFYEEK